MPCGGRPCLAHSFRTVSSRSVPSCSGRMRARRTPQRTTTAKPGPREPPACRRRTRIARRLSAELMGRMAYAPVAERPRRDATTLSKPLDALCLYMTPAVLPAGIFVRDRRHRVEPSVRALQRAQNHLGGAPCPHVFTPWGQTVRYNSSRSRPLMRRARPRNPRQLQQCPLMLDSGMLPTQQDCRLSKHPMSAELMGHTAHAPLTEPPPTGALALSEPQDALYMDMTPAARRARKEAREGRPCGLDGAVADARPPCGRLFIRSRPRVRA